MEVDVGTGIDHVRKFRNHNGKRKELPVDLQSVVGCTAIHAK